MIHGNLLYTVDLDIPVASITSIQSRSGELKVSEARYEDLLSEADEFYPKYLNHLWSNLYR